MDKWAVIELVLMLGLGIRWEVVIKMNPSMVSSQSYSFYHEHKYKDDAGLEIALKEGCIRYWDSI